MPGAALITILSALVILVAVLRAAQAIRQDRAIGVMTQILACAKSSR